MRKTLSIIAALSAVLTMQAESIDLQWIDKAPSYSIGQSWGVPFAAGEMNDNGSFTLSDASGNSIPTQSWVLARHSDGSVKWMGFYASIGPDQANGLQLTAVKGPKKVVKKSKKNVEPAIVSIVSSDTDKEIIIDNGLYTMTFPKSGSSLVSSIVMDGKTVASDGKLVCSLEDRSAQDKGVLSYKSFESKITSAQVERSGEVAAVVKIEGMHKALDDSRSWLPFSVRFYIYKDAVPVKIVHSFVFDGEPHTDFIKGVGLEFSIPFREQIQNRHVAFAGEGDGLWQEAAGPLLGNLMSNKDMEAYRKAMEEMRATSAQAGGQAAQAPAARPMGMMQKGSASIQFEGGAVSNFEDYPESSQRNLRNWAKYNDYKLIQPNSDGFTIQKRTGDHSTWFGTAGGGKARGFVLAGDVTGGIGVSLKNFWQSFPAELDVNDMRTDKAKLTVWMWSPSSDAMDLRHYDIEGHDLGSSYEDWVEGYDTAYGIGRTSEMYLFPYSTMPTREAISDMANIGQDIVQVMVKPQYLHDAGAFGVWSLPARDGNDLQQYLEKQIDSYLDFYEKAVSDQRWYGFWNYGDVMHSYNTSRHMWNYDNGGRAWDNTELETDIWLWFGFIRSGRADFYRMATAMTRHTSEVDAYHMGPMKGLGTRHNVSHWGCGAKEVRVGQAWWKRYYYYLTTDDRLGDLMHDSVDADFAVLEFDPLVRAQPRSQFPTAQPTRLRWGPDWTSLVGNWFTEWERTGDKKWLDKINAGMNSLCNLPNGLFTGQGPYGYDPETGVLTYEGDPDWITNKNHLANLQSSVEVFAEVLDEVDNEDFTKTYLEYASWYTVPKDDPIRDLPENAKYKNWWGHWNIARLLGIAASRSDNDYLKQIAWKRFTADLLGRDGKIASQVNGKTVDGPMVLVPITEDPMVSTNAVAQWNLEAIILPELLKDCIPEIKDIKPFQQTRNR